MDPARRDHLSHGARTGGYGRLFGSLPPAPALSPHALNALCRRIGEGALGENPDIPAGFTYLAQFVDHDLTFDPTPPGRRADGAANLRTPRLDLDSLYGAGPLDQPYLYDGPAKLLVGGTARLPDLPRNRHERAIIGDPRNDEHLLIAQLHLLFLRFHNAVVERVEPDFAAAQQLVRWHYQWIVLHDLLDRILGCALAAEVRARRRCFDGSFVPVEFSGAAYRFAHSMVRRDYRLNAGAQQLGKTILALDGAGPLEHLAGHRRLPRELRVQWWRFFGKRATVHSRLIGPSLAEPFSRLPEALDAEQRGLDRLDLLRSMSLGLPSGLDVARAMGEDALTTEELKIDDREVRRAPPLWYYVLAEARARGDGGRRLGPVGGRIVGEVLVGLVATDPTSYLSRWPTWRPTLADDFTMADLVEFTA